MSQKLKEKLDGARSDVEVAQRRGDLGRASELMYGVIPQLQRKIDAGQAAGQAGERGGDRRPISPAWSAAGPASPWTACWKASVPS